MAEPGTAREHGVQALTWAIRGLTGFLLLQVVTGLGLIVLISLYDLPSPSLLQTAELLQSLLILSWVLVVLSLASGIVYCVGLMGLYGDREELGHDHAASVRRVRIWLGVTFVLVVAGLVVPSLTGPFVALPGIGYAPPEWSWSLGVTLAGLRAIFAGLVLYYAVQGLAEEAERVRLLLGMVLGVAGAVLWAGLAAYAAGIPGPSIASLIPFLAGILAGLGTSAISLGLFLSVYREVRRTLGPPGRPP